ncbi:MAG: CCE_0567 family metalloprotein [Cyanobacteriota bacterium]|nr:CCE_0567 family metalloprotein [Cyanobacteriota bacterium]
MTAITEQLPTPEAVKELKTKIKRLNSKAGQMKMDLHDLAEGLPVDWEKLPEEAAKTHEIYRELDRLRKQLKTWESQLQ